MSEIEDITTAIGLEIIQQVLRLSSASIQMEIHFDKIEPATFAQPFSNAARNTHLSFPPVRAGTTRARVNPLSNSCPSGHDIFHAISR